MKINYKGFEISVKREQSLGGYSMLYFYVFEISSGFLVVDSFEDSEEMIEEKANDLKKVVDDYLENPSAYE